MQLPPAVPSRLAGAPGAAGPLPVERDPRAGAAPFRFAARRLHFPRDHAFFEDGDVQRHLYLQDVLALVSECPERPRVPEFACQVAGCRQLFDALGDFEHHYQALHANVCSSCGRAFPSAQLLDAHILEWHDALFQLLAQRQDMYQCLVEGCPEKFRTSGERKEHLVRRHLYPPDFRFDRPRKSGGPHPCVSAQAPVEAGEQTEGDTMEVCVEPATPTLKPSGQRAARDHRIPPTICFGQGASRGFRSSRRKSKQQ